MGDAVMSMLCVAPMISIKMVPHVDQLFRDDHFYRPRFRTIDSFEIDQHRVNPLPSQKDKGTTICRRYASTEPPSIHGPVCGHPERIHWQSQFLDILLHQRPDLGIGRFISH
jgi:hypothetical protein